VDFNRRGGGYRLEAFSSWSPVPTRPGWTHLFKWNLSNRYHQMDACQGSHGMGDVWLSSNEV